MEGDFDDEGGGGFFSLRWTNDGLLEEVFSGLGEEGEVGRGRVEDVFVDFRPSIDTLRLFLGDRTRGEPRHFETELEQLQLVKVL